MANQLIWVIDSPYSRAIKWLLINQNIAHDDYLLSWQTVKTDTLLLQHNPKQQVPTLLKGDVACYDSLLIALQVLTYEWHQTTDAKIFRLGDADFEKAIIFFFRAKLLAETFGPDAQSALMLAAGRQLYCDSIDTLFDHLLPELTAGKQSLPISVGVVLAFSTILACRALAQHVDIDNYRLAQLQLLSERLSADDAYQKMLNQYATSADCQVAFLVP